MINDQPWRRHVRDHLNLTLRRISQKLNQLSDVFKKELGAGIKVKSPPLGQPRLTTESRRNLLRTRFLQLNYFCLDSIWLDSTGRDKLTIDCLRDSTWARFEFAREFRTTFKLCLLPSLYNLLTSQLISSTGWPLYRISMHYGEMRFFNTFLDLESNPVNGHRISTRKDMPNWDNLETENN